MEIDDSSASMAMAIFRDVCPPIGQCHVAAHFLFPERRVESRACLLVLLLRLRHRRNKDKDARTSVPARRYLNDSDFPPAVLERRFGALDFGHLSMEGCRNILLDVSVCDEHDPPKSYLHFEFHIWRGFFSLCKILFLQFYEILSGDRSLPFGRFGGLPNGSNPSKSVGPRVPSDLAGRAVKPVYPIGALSRWYSLGNF